MAPLMAERTVAVIERDASTLSIAKVAQFLQESLGQKLTAYLSGLDHAKEVGAWIRGEAKPRALTEIRLRNAYQTVRLILKAYGGETAKAWLFGTNTRLGDEAPAYLLRHAKSVEDLRGIVPAARDFAGNAG